MNEHMNYSTLAILSFISCPCQVFISCPFQVFISCPFQVFISCPCQMASTGIAWHCVASNNTNTIQISTKPLCTIFYSIKPESNQSSITCLWGKEDLGLVSTVRLDI